MISAMDNRSYGAISKASTAGRSDFTTPELTPEQQKLLIELRRKKQELLLEIQVSDFVDISIKLEIFRCSYKFP